MIKIIVKTNKSNINIQPNLQTIQYRRVSIHQIMVVELGNSQSYQSNQ